MPSYQESLYFELSANYLNKIVQQLAKYELVITTRGKNGGVEISAQGEEISVDQLIIILEPREEVAQCDIFISHAGMGNVLLAAEYDKPIIVMPRKADLQEHINNHQLGTVEGLNNHESIYVVNDDVELADAISTLSSQKVRSPLVSEETYSNRQNLISFLENFLD